MHGKQLYKRKMTSSVLKEVTVNLGEDNTSVQKDKQVYVLRKKFRMTNCASRNPVDVLSLAAVATFLFPHQKTWRWSRAPVETGYPVAASWVLAYRGP